MAYNILNKNSMGANTYVADTGDDMLSICMKTDLPIGTKCICLGMGDSLPRGLYLWSPTAYCVYIGNDLGYQIQFFSKEQKIADLKNFKMTADILSYENPQEFVIIVPGKWQLIESLGESDFLPGQDLSPSFYRASGIMGSSDVTDPNADKFPMLSSVIPLLSSSSFEDQNVFNDFIAYQQDGIDQINAQTPFGMIIRIPGYTPPPNFDPGHVS